MAPVSHHFLPKYMTHSREKSLSNFIQDDGLRARAVPLWVLPVALDASARVIIIDVVSATLKISFM